MKCLLRVGVLALLACCCLLPGAGFAQLEAASEGPVSIGHHHLNVPDLDASRAFWSEGLGAEVVKRGPLEVMKLPNLLVALREQVPTGGSFGSSVNHIGLQVPDVASMVASLKARGVPIVTKEHIPMATGPVFLIEAQDTHVAFVESPSGVRIELFENRDLKRPIENHHVHFYTADPEATQLWYALRFGAKPRMRGTFLSADLPGVNLTFSPGEETVGTEGRALDHIGFEVRDLKGLCRILEDEGVVFSRPYSKIDALGLEIAFFTDPWGNYVELTEGLDAF